jgi:hypothetical protein
MSDLILKDDLQISNGDLAYHLVEVDSVAASLTRQIKTQKLQYALYILSLGEIIRFDEDYGTDISLLLSTSSGEARNVLEEELYKVIELEDRISLEDLSISSGASGTLVANLAYSYNDESYTLQVGN